MVPVRINKKTMKSINIVYSKKQNIKILWIRDFENLT